MIQGLKKLLDKLTKKPRETGIHEVYCQACGKSLTNLGGDISSSGRIYCHGYKEDGESRCLDQEMIMMMQGKIPMQITIFNYLDVKGVQREIKKGRLDKYSPLERIKKD